VKRLFGVLPEGEAAAHSATDSGVMDSTAPHAAFVKVRQEGPDGPVVVAPGSATPVTVAEPAKTLRTDFPTTTIRGMTPPTAAGSMVTASPTATTPDAVDRNASTGTFLPQSAGSPMNGTEPYLASETTTAPYSIASHPGGEGGEESRVDGGAVHGSIAQTRFGGRGRTPQVQMAVVAGGALLVATVLASVASVVRTSPARPFSPSSPSVTASASPAPSAVPSATVVASPPASSMAAMPALEPALETVAPPPEAPAPDTNREKPKLVRVEATATAPRSSATRAAERPGPGF
jgi:hypothetical protein